MGGWIVGELVERWTDARGVSGWVVGECVDGL